METIQKVKNIRKIISIITALCSPGILLVIGFFSVGVVIVLIVFIPFMIFGDSDSYSYQAVGEYSWLAPVQLDADGSAYIWPVPSIAKVSSTFGFRNISLYENAKMHKGIDIADGADKTELQPIYSMAEGTVTVAGSASGYGQAIYIDHGNGLVTKYGHLSAQMDVHVGDHVTKGQRIGRIGQGKVGSSTGPHLHFQVELNGSAVDPLEYVQPPGAQITAALSYEPLNIDYVFSFLTKRNSALADPGLLQAINDAGRTKNVSPYLLIAITGQEQSFVPRNNNHAMEIIKNPWNVFGCWCNGKGATLSTGQAALIAADTIIKLSQDLPAGRDPIQWLSAKDNPRGYYAEDNGWWIGVSKYFKLLTGSGGNSN